MFKDIEEKKEYLQNNRVIIDINDLPKDYFEWDEEGNILLDSSKCVKSDIDIDNYTCCIGWIMLQDSKMALLKNFFGDIVRNMSTKDYKTAKYNNILIPELARQFQNEATEYYFTKRAKSKTSIDFLMSLDFRNKERGEELIQGDDILENVKEMSIENILTQLEEYLITQGTFSEDIEKVKTKFIKQSIFNKFVKQVDENNGNWGIIRDKFNRFDLTPIYDVDCACDIKYMAPKKIRTVGEGKTDLKSLIEEFKHLPWMKCYLEEVLSNYNLETAFESSKTNTKVTIPNDVRINYIAFFNERFLELKNVYKQIYNEKEESREERE